MQIQGKQQEHQVIDFIYYSHKIFSNRSHLLHKYIEQHPYISCILDRNMHLRIGRLMMPLLGNIAQNKNIPNYDHAQDHYEDAYKV